MKRRRRSLRPLLRGESFAGRVTFGKGGSVYGGNDKDLKQVAEEVKQTVIGQDEAVDWLCAFVDAACARTRIIKEGGIDSSRLPNIGSALIVGPTASGKTHLLKTFARASGLLFQQIDASQMSGEGYVGNSFSKQWVRASAALGENPDRNILIFIDEVDKLMSQSREGWAGFDLLKPLEGGILEGREDTKAATPYALDCDRCVFVLAGAFTGIEAVIASRVGVSRAAVGFGSSAARSAAAEALDEGSLRAQITMDDVEKWGMPRELAGRLSTVRFLSALGEDALRRIVQGNKCKEYGLMLPHGAHFAIDQSAEDLIVANALSAHYGARSVNRQINEIFFGDLWRALSEIEWVKSVSLTAPDGKLGFMIEQGEGTPPRVEPVEGERLAASAAYGLLHKVHNYLVAHGGEVTLDTRNSLGDSSVEFAAALLSRYCETKANGEPVIEDDYSLAEIVLLNALLSLLHDWFPESDCTPDGLKTLLSMASNDGSARSPLDLLFYQLESGTRYASETVVGDNGEETELWSWMATNFVRNGDGLRPAETGGLDPGQDVALDYYTEFKGYPREARLNAVRSLAFRLL